MKKVIYILIVAALIIPTVVRADLIFEPTDAFYRRHKSGCQQVDRQFIVTSPLGSIDLCYEPGSEEVLFVIANDSKLDIHYTYQYQGEPWGLTTYVRYRETQEVVEAKTSLPFELLTGWVAMEHLQLVYDYISFAEEHGDSFYPYDAENANVQNTSRFVLWPWPGAPQAEGFIDVEDGRSLHFEHVYKDEDEQEWGFVNRTNRGDRNVWICISEPALGMETLNAEHREAQTAEWQPPEAQDDLPSLVLPMALVLSVAIVTVILIRVFWKRESK